MVSSLPLGLRHEWLAALKQTSWNIGFHTNQDLSGHTKSSRQGNGMEFSQYRPYGQGDDIRSLDWKAYARTEKFFVRQAEVEKNVKIGFILDQSLSMKYEEKQISKWLAACQLVALLTWVAERGGNTFHWISNPLLFKISLKNQWHKLLYALAHATPAEDFYPPSLSNTFKPDVLVIISDLYEGSFSWQELIKKRKTPTCEVIVLHLLSEFELNLSTSGNVRFKSLENVGEISVQIDKIKLSYKEKIQNWQKRLQDDFIAQGIKYYRVDFTYPVVDHVRAILKLVSKVK